MAAADGTFPVEGVLPGRDEAVLITRDGGASPRIDVGAVERVTVTFADPPRQR